MSFSEFERSLTDETSPPATLNAPLKALWLEAKGDWTGAHAMSQVNDGNSRSGAWVHAYLHRKEGDESNAAYWYARAGRPVATGDFKQEWSEIAMELLGSTASR